MARHFAASLFLEAGGGLFEREANIVIGKRGEHHAQRIGPIAHAAGPGVNVRLQEAQRHSCTISSFFLRVPRRDSAWPPQCGHASGCLAVSGTRAIRGMIGILREALTVT